MKKHQRCNNEIKQRKYGKDWGRLRRNLKKLNNPGLAPLI